MNVKYDNNCATQKPNKTTELSTQTLNSAKNFKNFQKKLQNLVDNST